MNQLILTSGSSCIDQIFTNQLDSGLILILLTSALSTIAKFDMGLQKD